MPATILSVLGLLILLAIVASVVQRFTAGQFLEQQRKHLELIDALREELQEYKAGKTPWERAQRKQERRRQDLDRIASIERAVKDGTSGYELSYLYDEAQPRADEGYLLWRFRYSSAALALDEVETEFRRRSGGIPNMFADEETPERKALWRELHTNWSREHPQAAAAYRRVHEAAYRRVAQFRAIEAAVRMRDEAENRLRGGAGSETVSSRERPGISDGFLGSSVRVAPDSNGG